MVVEADPRLRPGEARVRVTLSDGAIIEEAIDHPSGSPERPLTERNCARSSSTWRPALWMSAPRLRLFETCLGLERCRTWRRCEGTGSPEA